MFDGGLNPIPWLQEKTLSALTAAAALADLANEPDTTAWYAKTLRAHAQCLVAYLAPIVVLLHGAEREAATQGEWEPIVEGGSLALARWCKKWTIADPRTVGLGALADAWNDEERDAKAEGEARASMAAGGAAAATLRLELYAALTSRLLDERIPASSRRLLTFLMSGLRYSRHADAVEVSRRFLPTDAGLEPGETATAYRDLHERGLLELVEPEPEDGERRIWRLVSEDLNESRHRLPFREEVFGYPGARIAGKGTIGSVVLVELTEAMGAALAWWSSEENLVELGAHLQQQLGDDRVYIERIELRERSDSRPIKVRLRYPYEENDERLREEVRQLVELWLRERVGAVAPGGGP